MDLGKNQWLRSRTGSWLKPSSSSRQRVFAYEKELCDWFVKINVQINISLALRLFAREASKTISRIFILSFCHIR